MQRDMELITSNKQKHIIMMFVATDDERLFYVQQHAEIVIIKWKILGISH